MNNNLIVYNILEQHFKFDKIFTLIDYDADMITLYNELFELKKDSYEQNYRFIFLYYDTDYYITNNQPGLILRNLQRIIVSLDISNYFCLILTQKDITKELEILRQQETTDNCAIASIQHCLQDLLWVDVADTELAPEIITAKYQSLCGRRRSHRTLLYSLLQNKNLLDQGMVSYCDISY
jgi:hypothetical protein